MRLLASAYRVQLAQGSTAVTDPADSLLAIHNRAGRPIGAGKLEHRDRSKANRAPGRRISEKVLARPRRRDPRGCPSGGRRSRDRMERIPRRKVGRARVGAMRRLRHSGSRPMSWRPSEASSVSSTSRRSTHGSRPGTRATISWLRCTCAGSATNSRSPSTPG
jgi:hypothetical protein